MKTASRLISILVLAALFLAACSPQAPAGGSQPAGEQPTSSEPAATEGDAPTQAGDSSSAVTGDPVTLNFWVFEGEDVFLPRLIESFNQKYPHITIEVTDIPEADYVTKIDTALVANDPPDIGFIYERRWLKAGKFAPIDDALMENGVDIKDYHQGALGANCLYEGKVYCLGSYTGAVLMFYNKDMFDAAGVPYPSATEPMTIDDYVVMAKQLSKPSDDINQRVWGGNAETTAWWMDARTLFSDDGRLIDGYANDEATIHTYQALADMRRDGSAPSTADATMLEGTDLLAQGKLATSIIDNVVAIPSLEQAGIRYGAAVPPVEKAGDQPFIASWTDGFGVFAQSDHPAEAKLFAMHYALEGNKLQMEMGNLPLNLKLAEEMGYGSTNEGRQEVLDAMSTAREPLFVPGFWDVIAPLWDGWAQMIDEDRPAADVLNELAPVMQESLDQAWETWESIQ